MGRGEYRKMRCLITVVLLLAVAAIFLLIVGETTQCY